MKINTYDIDGVIYFGGNYDGLRPGEHDILITGRTVEEARKTIQMLRFKGIHNQVFFNYLPFDEKTRFTSGLHKGKIIRMLIESGYEHGIHFEDDEVQIEAIKQILPDITIVHVVSNLVEKENVRP